MRKLLIAAVTAAAVGTLGLSMPAQASANHMVRPGHSVITTITKKQTVVFGIPFSEIDVITPNNTCTIKSTKGLPGPSTVGTGSVGTHKCEVEIWGVWNTTPGTHKVTIVITDGTTTVTLVKTFTVLAAPCEDDAVGVGSDTITPLTDALATDYDNSLTARTACPSADTEKPFEYSWDAVNPVTGAIGDSIALKTSCTPIARPDGSSAGIAALSGSQVIKDSDNCVNFARSSRPRASTDPPFAAGGVAFTALAGDAVSWATPAVNTAAPATLTPAQLNAIYTCTDTNWNQVGGGNQTIAPFLPQSGSGTLSFFLAAIGVTTPGPCVSNAGNTLEENEGVNPVLNNPGAIFPYSVGDYIAQAFHSPKCLNSGCTPNSSGVTCIKLPGLLQFWCDVHGTMTPREINGIAPTVGSGTGTTINPAFPSTFDRVLYNVVPFDPSTTDHIPGTEAEAPGGVDLEGIFGAAGFDCSSAAAKADITAYGFLNLPNCGATN